MMKTVLYIFMLSCFASIQVMAMSCSVNCSVQESLQKEAKKAMPAGHECCHGKNQEENEKKPSCAEDLAGACFHKIIMKDTFVEKTESKVTSKSLKLIQAPVFDIIKIVGNYRCQKIKIPQKEFDKYKSQQNLYLLKDQFLI